MPPETKPIFFISHKHSDRKIASALSAFLNISSRKEIAVVQSSDPIAMGPRLGNVLTQELTEILWNTRVILLIYTAANQDWSWCMWECGVATKPGSLKTRIIVLQCGSEQPKVYADTVRVDVRDPGDVLKFVKAYLTDPEFIPGVGRALAPGFSPDGPEVLEAADSLYERLQEVIPKSEVAEWSAQSVLRLEVKAESGEKALSAVKQAATFEQTVLVAEVTQPAWHIFGLAQVEEGMSIGALIKHWREQCGGASPEWAEDIREQIIRAAMRELPVPRWTQLQEADGKECYAPILTRVRQLPGRDALQFDVSLVPFDPSRMTSAISEPYQREYATAIKRVEAYAPSLMPYLAPVARRHFHGWSEYVRELVTGKEGVMMSGRERLEITRLLVDATKRYVVVEPMVSNPRKMHSVDWIAYYDSLRERSDVEKVWVLCAKEEDVRNRISDVEESWKFRRERGFRTLYCSPRDFELAAGEPLSENQVIEDFGSYVKFLMLPAGTYTDSKIPNLLATRIRVAEPEERGLLKNIMDCTELMAEDWLTRIPRG